MILQYLFIHSNRFKGKQ